VLHMRRDNSTRYLNEIGAFERTKNGLEVRPVWTRDHGWHEKELLC
jgi:pilus assembly protein CpaF